jgi:HAD superfamily hydrolase (TIGR01509 family)
MPTPTLIVFDLGGVLVRLVRDWQHALELTGVPLPALGAPGPDWPRHHQLIEANETGSISDPDFQSEIRHCFPGFDCADYMKVFDAWIQGLYPGTPQLLADLKSAGYKTALLSNTNARHWKVLTTGQYAPLAKVDYPFASHLLRARKPNPEAYKSVERLTETPPDKILFFDDLQQNLDAARALDWQTDLIDRNQDGPPQIREHLRRRNLL